MQMRRAWVLLAATILLAACGPGQERAGGPVSSEHKGAKMAIRLTSTAFDNGKTIPSEYTCDGRDVSPPLSWSGAPDGTRSYALIVEDPDAPRGTFIHWVAFNVPPDVHGFDAEVEREGKLSNGAMQGTNGFGNVGYGGPCPPSGTHRYFFRIYALDTTLDLQPGARSDEVQSAMQGHVLAEGELMGTYSRK